MERFFSPVAAADRRTSATGTLDRRTVRSGRVSAGREMMNISPRSLASVYEVNIFLKKVFVYFFVSFVKKFKRI